MDIRITHNYSPAQHYVKVFIAETDRFYELNLSIKFALI